MNKKVGKMLGQGAFKAPPVWELLLSALLAVGSLLNSL